MSDMAYYLRDGGPWMYAIACLGAACVPIALAALILHAMRIRTMGCIWLGLGASVLLAGSVGTLMGISLAENAVATAMPAERQTMLAMGISISLYTEAFARFTATFGLPLIAGGLAVGHLIGTKGERGRWTLMPGIGAGGVALLGSFGALGWAAAGMGTVGMSPSAMLGGVAGLLAAFTLAGVGLREDVDEDRMAALGGARASAWLLCLLGVTAAAGIPRVSGTVMAFKAVATAAPEYKAEMLRAGMEMAANDSRPGLIAIVGVALAGPFLLLPVARWLKGALPMAGAFALLSVFCTTFGVSVYTASKSTGQIDMLVGGELDREAAEEPTGDLGMEPLGD